MSGNHDWRDPDLSIAERAKIWDEWLWWKANAIDETEAYPSMEEIIEFGQLCAAEERGKFSALDTSLEVSIATNQSLLRRAEAAEKLAAERLDLLKPFADIHEAIPGVQRKKAFENAANHVRESGAK